MGSICTQVSEVHFAASIYSTAMQGLLATPQNTCM